MDNKNKYDTNLEHLLVIIYDAINYTDFSIWQPGKAMRLMIANNMLGNLLKVNHLVLQDGPTAIITVDKHNDLMPYRLMHDANQSIQLVVEHAVERR